MLIARNLRKVFSTGPAVDGVSLEAKRGEILGLLGPNGAGKTTTIRLILNILQPDGGEVTFDGEPFSTEIRNLIGYLPEERGLYRKNKLLNVIIYFASLKGMDSAGAKRRALEWLLRFNLMGYADKKVEELSKGNQQKVQFIISVLHDPQLVVLDEPFAGLDPVNQILLSDELMRLKQRGKALIFSTHVMDQAEKLCDRICLINKGKVVLDGELNEVKRRYGQNSIHIEFEGNGAFLSTMPIFKKTLLYENSAELLLSDGLTPSEVLRDLSQRLAIRKFELREPSLQSIFLEMVGARVQAWNLSEASRSKAVSS